MKKSWEVAADERIGRAKTTPLHAADLRPGDLVLSV